MKALAILLVAAAFIAGSCGNDRGTAPSSIINDEGTVVSQEAHDQIEAAEQPRGNGEEDGDMHSYIERPSTGQVGRQIRSPGYGQLEAFAPAVIEQDKKTIYVGDSVTYTLTLKPLLRLNSDVIPDSEIFNGIAHYEICASWDNDTGEGLSFDTEEEYDDYERRLIQVNAATQYSLLLGQLEIPRPQKQENFLCQNTLCGMFPMLRSGNKIKFQIRYNYQGQYGLYIEMRMQYGNISTDPTAVSIGSRKWHTQIVHER